MTTLSVTFHCTALELENWKNYLNAEFLELIDKLNHVENFIFSEVHTEMIQEGKNFNLFLFFNNEEVRDAFIENELKSITEKVENKFANEVMVFLTFLHPIKHSLS